MLGRPKGVSTRSANWVQDFHVLRAMSSIATSGLVLRRYYSPKDVKRIKEWLREH